MAACSTASHSQGEHNLCPRLARFINNAAARPIRKKKTLGVPKSKDKYLLNCTFQVHFDRNERAVEEGGEEGEEEEEGRKKRHL